MVMKKEPRAKKRVFVVDDHPIVRHGLAQLINQQTDLEVCGEAEDAVQALENIMSAKPDIAIVDLTLKTTSGLDLIKNLKTQSPNVPILVLSMHDESVYAERALRAGARGYIMKEKLTDNVVLAIRRILDGKLYLSDEMREKMLYILADVPSDKAPSPLERLSDRELQVFELIGGGFETSEIAEKLHMSRKTVHSYRTRIKEKFHLKKSSELQKLAFHWTHSGNMK